MRKKCGRKWPWLIRIGCGLVILHQIGLAENCAAGPDFKAACLLANRDLNLAPQGTKRSVELLEPSCMVQAKEPINRFALPVQAPHKFSSGDILLGDKAVELDL
jgi:hypothetical protein